MARKKVVLFIVEGISDKESLELSLTELLEPNSQVVFEIAAGDITSDRSVDATNVKKKITELVKGRGKRKFRASDYKIIIHLVDTDGAFISEDNIFLDETAGRFVYTVDGIYANNKDKVAERNKRKQGILNILSTTDQVMRTVPYKVYYFSCNLEHVLHNKMNAKCCEKKEYAIGFQEKYRDDPTGFVSFICDNSFAVKMSYDDSWQFIKKNSNSIKRYTNFNIVLEELYIPAV